MANEISGFVIASSTGNYALVVNPANKAQAWDTLAGAWATKNPADADQQIALGSGISEGAGYETQYANLPAGLDASEEYEVWLYDSSNNWIGNKLYRGSSVSDSLAAIAVTDAVVDSINAKLGTPAVDIAADIAAIETGIVETRDFEEVQVELRVHTRNDGKAYTPDKIVIAPGETITAGFDCRPGGRPSIVCPGRSKVGTVGTPSGLTGELSATKIGTDGQLAKFRVVATSSATVGTSQWVTIEVTNSFGDGPVKLSAEVLVRSATGE